MEVQFRPSSNQTTGPKKRQQLRSYAEIYRIVSPTLPLQGETFLLWEECMDSVGYFVTTSISDRVTAACSDRSSAMQRKISADGRVTEGV